LDLENDSRKMKEEEEKKTKPSSPLRKKKKLGGRKASLPRIREKLGRPGDC